MKKLFLNFTVVLVATSLMLVSCNTKTDGDGVDDPNGSIPAGVQEDLATALKEQGYTLANAAFGTAYPSYSYIDVYFANEADTVAISFNTEEGEETLPIGEYVMDETTEYLPGTWDPEFSYWWNAKIAEETEDDEYYFSEGTVSVAKSGRNYAVKIDLVDANGGTIKWAYVGQIELEVFSQEPAQESFDLTWDDLDNTYSYYYLSTDYSLYFYVLAVVDSETGREIDIVFTGTDVDTNGKLPTGTFDMATTSITENIIIPGFVNEGYVEGTYQIDWNNQSATFYPFVAGSISVAESEDVDNTTLSGSLYTEDGTEVTVNISGAAPTLDIYEPSEESVATSSVKSVKPVKQGKKLGRRVVRK